ncbi:MAG: TIGR03545 family protein [Desulfobacterales bacterium]|jgi:uncharacterized protein (TIGR03545 family)|nr:TIGR03545 family protein [Desulfobacterales bacterium]MBT7698191.1 TIGR03545 family protein [Desulfobacterales bacterium]
MKRWIRWQGLGAFIITIIFISVVWFLFVDGVVRRIIEKTGTEAVGAKVELAKADLSLFPAGLELTGMKVTNPDQPMTNIVEIERIDMSLETLQLIRRKVIVENMSVDGVRLNTPRNKSGAILDSKRKKEGDESDKTEKKEANTFCGKFTLPDFKALNIDDILKKEKLKSLEIIQSLKKDIEAEKKKWQKDIADLPDKKKFAEYQKRMKKLKSGSGGFGKNLGLLGETKKLQEDIKNDIDLITNAQNSFSKRIKELNSRIAEAKEAPLKDVKRLKEKYGMSSGGVGNLSRMVLGSKLCGGMKKAVSLYEKASPYIKKHKRKAGEPEEIKPVRGKGVNIRFKEFKPLPDFLIREMKTSVILDAGLLKGKIDNITSDQDILGKPLTFIFFGDKMKGVKSIDIKGSLNHINPEQSIDQIVADIIGYEAIDIILSDDPNWPVKLNKANVNFKIDGKLIGEEVNTSLNSVMKSVNISAGKKESYGALSKALKSAISDISSFKADAKVTGTIDDYNISLSSDIDGILKKAVGKSLKNQAAKFEKELKKAILDKTGGPLKGLTKDKNSLNIFDKELADRSKAGKNILGSGGGGFKLPF